MWQKTSGGGGWEGCKSMTQEIQRLQMRQRGNTMGVKAEGYIIVVNALYI